MIEKKEAGIGKRGQSTIFIIAGVVIVIIAVLVVFFFREDVQVGRRITSTQVEPVREYVEGCIEDELEKDLKLLRSNSGFFGPANYFKQFGDPGSLVNINYVAIGRYRQLPRSEDIEVQIGKNIKEKLLKPECSLDRFEEEEDFIIKEDTSKIVVDVSLGDHVTVANVNYPMDVEKGEFKASLNEFSVEEEDDFGILFRLMEFILNKEISEAYIQELVNTDEFRNMVGNIDLFYPPVYICDDQDYCHGFVSTIKEGEKKGLTFAICKKDCEAQR